MMRGNEIVNVGVSEKTARAIAITLAVQYGAGADFDSVLNTADDIYNYVWWGMRPKKEVK